MTLQQDREQKFTQLVQGAPHAPITEPSGPIDPTDPADLQQDDPERPQAPKRSRRGLRIGAIAAAVAVPVVAAGALAFGGLNQGDKEAGLDNGGPVAEGPANPGEEAPATPEELTAEQLEIPAGLETEQLGQLIIDRFDSWQNAGTNDPAIYSEWRAAGVNNVSTGDFVTAKAEEFAAVYRPALYVEGYVYDDFDVEVNANTLELNLLTSNPEMNPEDSEAFQRNVSFDEAREISSEGTPGKDGYTRVIEIDYTESNNANLNRAGEDFAPETASFGTPKGTYTLTLVTQNGTEKIASMSATAR